VGIYALQATRYLTGAEPVEVSATSTTTDHVTFAEVEESLVWQLKFPGGGLASCSTTYAFNDMRGYRAYAENGWFGLDPAYEYDGQRGLRSDGQMIALPHVDQFALEMDDFAQCILNNRPTRVPGEEGLRDIKIMMAIYEAARTGKTVTLG